MKQILIQNTLLAVSALGVGPIAGRLTGSIRASDGGPDASALISAAPVVGLVKTLGAVALAAGMGVLAARLAGRRVGMFCVGLVLAWAAWHGGRIDEIIRTAQSADPMLPLAVEGAIFGVLGVVIACLISRVSSLEPGYVPGSAKTSLLDTSAKQGLDGRTAWVVGAIVALVVGGAVAWAMARSELVGQTFAAAVAAGLIGSAVARIAAPGAPVAMLVAGGVALAVIGPILGVVLNGSGIVADLYAGHLTPLARPMPLDWVSGIFIGCPIGSAWAAAMTTHAPGHHHETPGAAVGPSGS